MADTQTPSLESKGQTSLEADNRKSAGNERSLVVHSQASSSHTWSWFRYPLFAAGVALLLSPFTLLLPGEAAIDPTNYAERTRRVLKTTP